MSSRKPECETVDTSKSSGKCEGRAKYLVHHKDHPESKSFYVCEKCIPAYNHKMHPDAEPSFIIKDVMK